MWPIAVVRTVYAVTRLGCVVNQRLCDKNTLAKTFQIGGVVGRYHSTTKKPF